MEGPDDTKCSYPFPQVSFTVTGNKIYRFLTKICILMRDKTNSSWFCLSLECILSLLKMQLKDTKPIFLGFVSP